MKGVRTTGELQLGISQSNFVPPGRASLCPKIGIMGRPKLLHLRAASDLVLPIFSYGAISEIFVGRTPNTVRAAPLPNTTSGFHAYDCGALGEAQSNYGDEKSSIETGALVWTTHVALSSRSNHNVLTPSASDRSIATLSLEQVH